MKEAKKTGLERVIILLVVLVGLLIVALTALGFWYYGTTPVAENVFVDVLNQRIEFAEGLLIDGVAVGGMTVEEARPLVQASSPAELGTVMIEANGETAELDLSSLTPRRDYETVLQQAILLGNDGDREQRNAERGRISEYGESLVTPLKYDAATLREEVEKIATQLSVDPEDASFRLLSKAEQEERGIAIDTHTLIYGSSSDDETDPANSAAAETIRQLFDYTEEKPGSKVDADALMVSIQEALDNSSLDQSISAPTVEVAPLLKLDDLKYDMVEISRASSSFAASAYSGSNRMFNINKAAEMINGYILQPGEEFSCNGVLGPRSTSTGWKEAGAIRDGQSVQETGGGICQVSSTLFNSVLKADLGIVKRSPHSWPLSYIPAGQDATISTGGPDFIFKNDRDTAVILIAEANLDKKEITVAFYGKRAENQEYDEIKLVSEQTSFTKQPATEYRTVKSMKAGSSNTVRKGRSGSTYDTYKEYYKDGQLLKRELSHSSKYRAFSTIVERGPASSSSSGSSKGNASAQPAPQEAVTQPQAVESTPVAEAPAPEPEPEPAPPAAPEPVNDILLDIPEEG